MLLHYCNSIFCDINPLDLRYIFDAIYRFATRYVLRTWELIGCVGFLFEFEGFNFGVNFGKEFFYRMAVLVC